MTRLLSYPLLALALLLVWLLLVESLSPGALLLGAVLAVAGSGVLAALGMPRWRRGRWRALPGLLADLLVEIVQSNYAVVRIIIRPHLPATRRAGFVRIPLDMRSPHGLSALACILTVTPGTLWVDYDAEAGMLLLHVLDLADEERWVRTIKDRWERPLREIFE